ncbi:hypothetical protein DPMN_070653 [Dreissena polymorpha]|uniref:Uncharacterized protein n=1 Tax=Dreissena polymorpha TaxID=45954 RepID=A0A9D4BX86_DREPO|nr:hypothetical protein DPMN_070653 [Dreissena polymorpha]
MQNCESHAYDNMDVQDGRVNGSQGVVVDSLPNSTNIHAILVKFDKGTIGQKAR